MKDELKKSVWVAFLRGINVGGHHKVPMAELKATLASMGFSDIKTRLNSGNVIFTTDSTEIAAVEEHIAEVLEKQFGFPIPILIRKMDAIKDVISEDPFANIQKYKDLQLYATFVRHHPLDTSGWSSPDGSFQVLGAKDRMIFSSLDLSRSRTVNAMKLLEMKYTKDITTRNWNTILKLVQVV